MSSSRGETEFGATECGATELFDEEVFGDQTQYGPVSPSTSSLAQQVRNASRNDFGDVDPLLELEDDDGELCKYTGRRFQVQDHTPRNSSDVPIPDSRIDVDNSNGLLLFSDALLGRNGEDVNGENQATNPAAWDNFMDNIHDLMERIPQPEAQGEDGQEQEETLQHGLENEVSRSEEYMTDQSLPQAALEQNTEQELSKAVELEELHPEEENSEPPYIQTAIEKNGSSESDEIEPQNLAPEDQSEQEGEGESQPGVGQGSHGTHSLEPQELVEDASEQQSEDEAEPDAEQHDVDSAADGAWQLAEEELEQEVEESLAGISEQGGYEYDDEELDLLFPDSDPEPSESGMAEDVMPLPDYHEMGLQLPPSFGRQNQTSGGRSQVLNTSANRAPRPMSTNPAGAFFAAPSMSAITTAPTLATAPPRFAVPQQLPPNAPVLPSFPPGTDQYLFGSSTPQFVAPPPLPANVPFVAAAGPAPYWAKFYAPTPAIAANPARWAAAHALIASNSWGSQLRSPYMKDGKGDFYALVRNVFIPHWIRQNYPPGQNIPAGHKNRRDWHTARPQREQDQIRIFVQQQVEARLPIDVAAEVQRLRYPTSMVTGGGPVAGPVAGPYSGPATRAYAVLNAGPYSGPATGAYGVLNAGSAMGFHAMSNVMGTRPSGGVMGAYPALVSGGGSIMSNAMGGGVTSLTTSTRGVNTSTMATPVVKTCANKKSRQIVGENTRVGGRSRADGNAGLDFDDLQNVPHARMQDRADRGFQFRPAGFGGRVQPAYSSYQQPRTMVASPAYQTAGNAPNGYEDNQRRRQVSQQNSPFEYGAASYTRPPRHYTPLSFSDLDPHAQRSTREYYGQSHNPASASNRSQMRPEEHSRLSNDRVGAFVPENNRSTPPSAQRSYRSLYQQDERFHSQGQSWDAGFGASDPSSAYNAETGGDTMARQDFRSGSQPYMTGGRPRNGFENSLHGNKRKSLDEEGDDLVDDSAQTTKHRRTQ